MASDVIVMARQSARRRPPHRLKRHVAAIRAFHAGLLSETHRHLYTLRQMAPYIDTLRHPSRLPDEKLAAAEASCRQLKALERLRQPWRDTYRDLRDRLRRVRAMLESIAGPAKRMRG